MKKQQVHRKFAYNIGGYDNKLLCERAVVIAAQHLCAEYYEQVEAGIWIVWDHAGRAWCFQKKPDGFTMDSLQAFYCRQALRLMELGVVDMWEV